jgi:hypothetical protein
LVWYDIENLQEDSEELDVEPIIEDVASQVLGNMDWLEYSLTTDRTARHTFQTSIQVKYKNEERTASLKRVAQDIVPPDAYPFSVYAGEDIYGIETEAEGESYRITENGISLEEDFPSASLAFGSLVGPLLERLKEIEAGEGREETLQVDEDFLLGLAAYVMGNGQITEEAREHFVTFVELVTNQDLEAQLEEPEE